MGRLRSGTLQSERWLVRAGILPPKIYLDYLNYLNMNISMFLSFNVVLQFFLQTWLFCILCKGQLHLEVAQEKHTQVDLHPPARQGAKSFPEIFSVSSEFSLGIILPIQNMGSVQLELEHAWIRCQDLWQVAAHKMLDQ